MYFLKQCMLPVILTKLPIDVDYATGNIIGMHCLYSSPWLGCDSKDSDPIENHRKHQSYRGQAGCRGHEEAQRTGE